MSTEILAFENRLRKRHKHLKKWAKRQRITCYRLYEKDLAEFPFILDILDGHVVAWISNSSRESFAENEIRDAISAALDLSDEKVIIKERGIQKGLQHQYEKLGRNGLTKTVHEGGLSFELNLTDYLDVGLFLDHRPVRHWIRDMSHGKSVLNLFAYTGSVTCYAIGGGAKRTTTVDMSRTYLDWAQRNLRLNGIGDSRSHQLVLADCIAWLETAVEGGDSYDIIFCDPPTFSNSKKMDGSFNVDDDYPFLITQCSRLLRPGGTLFFSTNSRKFKLDPTLLPSHLTITDVTKESIPEDFRNDRIHRLWKLE